VVLGATMQNARPACGDRYGSIDAMRQFDVAGAKLARLGY